MTNDEPITLILPSPPPVNHLYASVVRWKAGKPICTRVPAGRGVRFKKKVKEIAEGAGVPCYEGDVEVELIWFRPKRVGDLDGVQKAVFDALTGVWYNDDKQIAVIHAMRFEDKDNPRIEVTVTPVPTD